jgi:hypothetical protein
MVDGGGFFLLQRMDMEHDGYRITGLEGIGHPRPFGQEPSADITSLAKIVSARSPCLPCSRLTGPRAHGTFLTPPCPALGACYVGGVSGFPTAGPVSSSRKNSPASSS